MPASTPVLLARQFPGLNQQVLVTPEGELIFNLIKPAARLPMHQHDEGQLGFALRGAFQLELSTSSWKIGGPSGYILAPNTPHGAVNLTDSVVPSVDVKRRLTRGAHTSAFQVLEAGLRGPVLLFETDWALVMWRQPSAAADSDEGRRHGDHRIVVNARFDAVTIRGSEHEPDPRVGRAGLHVIDVWYRDR